MLSAMEALIKSGSDLNELDEQGAAPVSAFLSFVGFQAQML